MGYFGPENGTPSKLWIGSKNFKILRNESGQQVDENDANDFFQKKCLWNNQENLTLQLRLLNAEGQLQLYLFRSVFNRCKLVVDYYREINCK